MTQAKRKPEPEASSPIDEIYKLVGQCSTEELNELVEEVKKLLWLRERVAEAESSIAHGKGIPAEEVFAELRQRYEGRASSQ